MLRVMGSRVVRRQVWQRCFKKTRCAVGACLMLDTPVKDLYACVRVYVCMCVRVCVCVCARAWGIHVCARVQVERGSLLPEVVLQGLPLWWKGGKSDPSADLRIPPGMAWLSHHVPSGRGGPAQVAVTAEIQLTNGLSRAAGSEDTVALSYGVCRSACVSTYGPLYGCVRVSVY